MAERGGKYLGSRKAYTLRFPVAMAEKLESMAEAYGVSVQALVQMMIGQNLVTSDRLIENSKEVIQKAFEKMKEQVEVKE